MIYRRLFKYGAFVLYPLELYLRKYYAPKHSIPPVVFIVGAPRSGSTILYQYLSAGTDVGYISNFMNAGREVPVVAAWLHCRKYGNTRHASFSSSYGITEKDGALAPNEGLFWKAWFKGEHSVQPENVPESSLRQLRRVLLAHSGIWKKPLLIKNLSWGMRLDLLRHILPETRVIHIKRNAFYNIQSMLLAKRKHGIPAGKLWSIRPPQYKQLLTLPEMEQVTQQYDAIETEIRRALSYYPADKQITVHYEDFMEAPDRTVGQIRQKLLNGGFNLGAIKNAPLQNGNKLKLNPGEEKELRQIIEKAGWNE